MASNLPPGVTQADIDRHFDGPKCSRCGNRRAYGHAQGCPRGERPEPAFCMVCRPPCPDDARQTMADSVGWESLPFCDQHDDDDLKAKLERDEQRRQAIDQEHRLESTFERDDDTHDTEP